MSRGIPFDGLWYLPQGRAHSTHILKPRLAGRPDGLARENYGHSLAVNLGLAHYGTELIGRGVRQYLVIERYDRVVTSLEGCGPRRAGLPRPRSGGVWL